MEVVQQLKSIIGYRSSDLDFIIVIFALFIILIFVNSFIKLLVNAFNITLK